MDLEVMKRVEVKEISNGFVVNEGYLKDVYFLTLSEALNYVKLVFNNESSVALIKKDSEIDFPGLE